MCLPRDAIKGLSIQFAIVSLLGFSENTNVKRVTLAEDLR
jgi:hypothetical protein